MPRTHIAKSGLTAVIASFLCLVACRSESGSVSVEPLLSDGAVLQQKSSMTICGKASPGCQVSLSTDWDYSVKATAGIDSTWSVTLVTPQADLKRHNVVVETAESSLCFSNILIGEVWLAVGQTQSSYVSDADVAKEHIPTDSLARFFIVRPGTAAEPKLCVSGVWKLVSKDNYQGIGRTSLSFATHLRDSLQIPVGVIVESFPEAPIKAWVDPSEVPSSEVRNNVDNQFSLWRKGHDNYIKWLSSLSAIATKDVSSVYDEYMTVTRVDVSPWPQMEVPGLWGSSVLPEFSGVVWFSREVNLPHEWLGHRVRLIPGRLGGRGVVYVNQTAVGEFDPSNLEGNTCVFDIPKDVIKPGSTSIVIRMLASGATGGFYGVGDGSPIRAELLPNPDVAQQVACPDSIVRLDGKWSYYAMAAAQGDSIRLLGKPENDFMKTYRGYVSAPRGLYGAAFYCMIAPLEDKKLAGVISDLGLRNASGEEIIRDIPLFAKSIRKVIDDDGLPFLFVQSGRASSNQEEEVFGNGIREAQMRAVSLVKGASIVSTLDLTPANGFGSRVSRQNMVGARLARLALGRVYGLGGSIAASPIPLSATASRQIVNIKIENASGLRINTNLPTAFEVAGPDSVFYPAKALAGDNSITVFSHMVPNPTFVRYAHHDGMEPTLWNDFRLPAPSFFLHTQKEEDPKAK